MKQGDKISYWATYSECWCNAIYDKEDSNGIHASIIEGSIYNRFSFIFTLVILSKSLNKVKAGWHARR